LGRLSVFQENDIVAELSLDNVDRAHESKQELALYRALKPYIGHCLSLNHEINNPLAGIIGYTEVLLQDPDQLTDSQRQFLAQVLECAERVKEVVYRLSEEKIALAEKIDLKSVTAAYKAPARPLD
jgi:signal transduction histidine kinase